MSYQHCEQLSYCSIRCLGIMAVFVLSVATEGRSRDMRIHEVVTSPCLKGTGQSKELQEAPKQSSTSAPQGPLRVSTSRIAGRTRVPALSEFALSADTTDLYQGEGYACSAVTMHRAGSSIVMRVELLPCASPPVRFVKSRCRTRPSTLARKLGLRQGLPFRLTPGAWHQCLM